MCICLRCGLEVQKSALFGLSYPLAAVAIAVKENSLMRLQLLTDKLLDFLVKAGLSCEFFQSVCKLLKAFCNCSIEDIVSAGNIVRGSRHTELEFSSGVGKR